MQSTVLLLLTTVVAMALAGGQFYVPRAYYTIDAEGHASAPVPLRRLRRSLAPYPYGAHGGYGHGGHFGAADANANANADAYSSWGVSSANANANANAHASATRSNGYGGWALPSNGYGSANPNALKAGQTKFQYGPVVGGRSISASSSVGIDHTGRGYYEQKASSA